MSCDFKIITGEELLLRPPRRSPLVTQRPLLDRWEEGGLPRGSLIEISGTGRFTLALAAVSAATRMGESAAMIDLGDHLDPQGAFGAGMDLSRLWWVRPHTIKEAMSATEMVLATGFSFVALELSIISPRRTSGGMGIRLSRAPRAQNALIRVSVPFPVTGSAADLVVQIERSKPVWIMGERGPRLLRALEVDLTVRRRKGARREISGEIFLPLERTIPDV